MSVTMRARLAEGVASTLSGFEIASLRQGSRGRANVALVRAHAMYLTHVTFSISLTATGRAFGRDRTTVRHACARIELARDNPNTEFALNALEAGLLLQACQISSERNMP